MKINRANNERIALILLIAIVVAVALNSGLYYLRIDMTESKAFTISDVSRDLFREVEDELLITYYVSDRLTRQFPQPQEIIDLLGEYAATSRGAIRLEVVDPADRDTDMVEALGVIPQQLRLSDSGEQTQAVVYSGIVLSYLDRTAVIPFIFATNTLEYEVTSTAQELVRDEHRTAAILVQGGTDTMNQSYTYLSSQLSRSFEIIVLDNGEPVPDDVDVLIAVAPQHLDEAGVAEIRSFISRGGSVLFAVDRVDVSLETGLVPIDMSDAPIFPLLEEYGFVLGDEFVLDQSYNQIIFNQPGARYTVQRIEPYPLWPVILNQYTSHDHPITARFTGLDLYWAGYLVVDDESNDMVIAATTPQAWLMGSPYPINPQNPAAFSVPDDSTIGQYSVVGVTGTGDDGQGGRLVVVTDSDFVNDLLLQATSSAYNLEFAEGAAQWLSNDEALLEIRTRDNRDMRLNRIEDPQRKQFAVGMATAINVYVIPALVILFGVRRFIKRRRRARRYHTSGDAA